MILSDLYPNTPWPIWLMRQAGRILPEYRQIRSTVPSFWELCSDEKKIVEITQMPIKALGVDAAIFFSDILVPLACFDDIAVKFVQKSKPQVRTHLNFEQLAIASPRDPNLAVPFVMKGIKSLRQSLSVPLIAFSGTPWTTALYVQRYGQNLSVEEMARYAVMHLETFAAFIERLTDLFAAYLIAQREAGAQQIMLFDSWALFCPLDLREMLLVQPVVRLAQAIKKADPTCPVIYYGRGVLPDLLPELKGLIDVFALSSDASIGTLQKNYPGTLFQGNLDPAVLERTPCEIKQVVNNWFQSLREPVIMNLGAGLLPTTPLEHVKYVIELVREQTRR